MPRLPRSSSVSLLYVYFPHCSPRFPVTPSFSSCFLLPIPDSSIALPFSTPFLRILCQYFFVRPEDVSEFD